jgi:hypothetical protein
MTKESCPEPGTQDLLGIIHMEIPTAVALIGITRVEEIARDLVEW